MSFSNDEDGDGLAALFGGITPQGGARAEPGPRRAAAEAAPVAPTPVPPAAQEPASSPATPVALAPQYPGLAPQQAAPPQTAPPSAFPAPGYAPPAAPAYEMPAPAASPGYSQPAPRAYDLPAPAAPPSGAAAAQQYPGLAPATPAYPPTAQYPAGVDPAADVPPAPQPPAYGPPASAAPTSPPPAYRPPAYDPPAAAPPPRAYEPPTYQPPTYQPPVSDPPVAYEPAPAAPPVSDPPPGFGAPPTDGAGPSYDLPAPEAIVEPPAPGGFEALGLQPPVAGGDPVDQARAYAAPAEVPRAEPPAVRSDAGSPATVFPPGPLLPSATAAVETPEDLERSTVGEKVGLAVAILTGPIGLVVAIVTAARGARRRGWLIGMAKASLVLAVISTIAAGIGGYTLWNIRADQIQHDAIAAASAEFCAAGAADPSIVTPPVLGWPAPGATTTESLAAMQAWTDNWTTLAATSPATLRTGMELLATRGQVIIDAVTASRSIDDAANQQQISQIEAQSGVAAWYATYCAQP